MGMTERIKTWARRINRDAITLWFAYRDARTPLAVKARALACRQKVPNEGSRSHLSKNRISPERLRGAASSTPVVLTFGTNRG